MRCQIGRVFSDMFDFKLNYLEEYYEIYISVVEWKLV